jgi:GT2 family glycosyltransferase
MDLSVIVVNWNTKALLLQCLESVFERTKEIEREVLVVDNGSSDGSGPAARERFPQIKLIENEENVGFAKANNQAILRSKGDYLLLLNPDTRINEGAIERLLFFMKAHPDAGLAGAQLLNPDGTKQNSIANFPSLATELLNKSLLRRLFPEKFPGKERAYAEPIEVDSVIGACMMVRKEAVEAVGSLDEGYFLFLEETDWCYRLKKAGWKIYHVPQAEIYHFQGKSAEKDKKRAKVEYYRSRYYYFRNNKGGFQRPLLVIGLLARLGVELVLLFLGCVLTGFRVKPWRRKLSAYAYLMEWHLRLCPAEMGLRSAK